MRVITVTPAQLEQTAAQIDNENDNYRRLYAQLFDAVDTMKAGWSGKDNEAFTNRIHTFESDFHQISVLCTQYAEFLRNSAGAYRRTQETIASQANQLKG